ncbi:MULTISPECIES: diguanylate cyclase [unclassified Methylophaga]|jgi:diguanylate cyclase (GGDEF)-like protein|uniref:diguanylate cyclase n=2 Tax=Methylophaga TaxID=40222 RepID=UPI000C8A6E70|nr:MULTISPECIES: diguanylate cyclase [unclassified Methylophaga]MAK67624.1 diguanylate cyclase [Methylophaga sp.]MAY18858.1 diguanylate cyclase [Methylophaga sp.]HCD04072.1 GGDEF domain-containing protein [Methylophaga sp.]|tara:strand:+ start:3904 stop:6069 length:2166 start_codon:yes stop_codon:yes gene_type:complete
MSDLSIHNLSLTSRLARLLLFMALLVAQGVLFAATTVQTDLENWQYRWGDSPFIDGKPEWAMPDQQNHSDWLAIPKPAHPPNRQGRENIWYRTTLPETNLIDPVVFISSIDLIAEVYLEQQLIYRFGNFDADGKGDYQGWPWHIIGLPDDYVGKTLYFRVYSDYTDIGLWGEKKLLERSAALLNILKNSYTDLIVSAFFFFIALLAFAFSAMRGDNREFIYLGLFSLASAGNLLGESQAVQLLIYAPLAKTYLAAISYFSIPIFIALILNYWLAEQGDKLMLRIAQMHITYVLICLVLSLSGIWHLAYFYPIFDMLFIVTLSIMLWICVRHFKVMSFEQRLVMGAFGIYAIFFLIDMCIAHGLLPWIDFPLAYGGLIFALMLVMISLRHYRQTQQALTELNVMLEKRVSERTASLQNYVQLEQQRANQLALINEFSLRLESIISRLQRSQSLEQAGNLICHELHNVFAPIQLHVNMVNEFADLSPQAVLNDKYRIDVEDLQLGKQTFITFNLPDISSETAETRQSIEQFVSRAIDRLSVTLSGIKLREDLHIMSFEDALTGLKNRRFFDDALQREIQIAQRHRQAISLLICDIDHFKEFNDQFGHDAGDLALREVASLMLEHFRETDIPCRYGGEEFVVLMPEANLNDALERAKSLLLKISSKTITYNGKDLSNLTISIGISGWDGKGKLPAQLLPDADKALYRAKLAGRNRVEIATGNIL